MAMRRCVRASFRAVLCGVAAHALTTRTQVLRLAATEVSTRIFDACPSSPPSCASSTDDYTRGGRNFIEPWVYEGSYEEALRRLSDLLVLLGYDVESSDRAVIAASTQLHAMFYATPGDVLIQVRAVGQNPNRKLDSIRTRCGFEPLPVLRNRRRRFGILQSPFDEFGPSLSDPATLYDSESLKDLDPKSPAFQPPDINTRRWLRENSYYKK